MKKKILALLLALAMALSLMACTGGTPDPTKAPDPSKDPGTEDTQKPDAPSGDKIDINVIAAEYGQNTKKWWADFQDEFNKTYENINLVVEVVSWKIGRAHV